MRGTWICIVSATMTRNAIGKGLAICSSVLLAGCFVAYRQNQAKEPDVPAMLPGSKSSQLSTHEFEYAPESDFMPQLESPTAHPVRKTVLPSSKSIDAILRPRDWSEPLPPSSGRNMLPGSKSLVIPNDGPVNRNSIDAILNGERKSTEKTKEPQPESEP